MYIHVDLYLICCDLKDIQVIPGNVQVIPERCFLLSNSFIMFAKIYLKKLHL